jgi:PAS domain S-box-containing protein
MMSRIKSILSPPVFEHDPDKTWVAQVVNAIIWTILTSNILYVIANTAFFERTAFTELASLLIAVISLGTWILMRRGYVYLSAQVWILSLWVVITLVAPFFEGVGSAIFSFYVIPILLAGLLLGRRVANAYAVISVAVGLAMLVASIHDVIPHRAEVHSDADLVVRWLINSIIFVVAAIVLHYVMRHIAEALDRAQDNARALAATQALLEAAIDQSPAGIVIADAPDGRLRMVNQAALALGGGSREEINGIPIDRLSTRWQVYYLDGTTPYETTELALSRAILRGETVRAEEIIIRQESGEDRWISANAAPIYNADGSIRAGIIIFLDITERYQAREALRNYATRLRILHDIDRAILHAETPAAIADVTLRHLRELIPSRRASVVLLDLAHSELEILAAHVNGETTLGAQTRAPISMWAEIDTLRQGQIFFVHDLAAISDPSITARQLRAENIQAYVSVPLMAHNTLIGALNIGMDQPGSLTPGDIEIAREVANQIAVVLQQARLHEQVQHHAEDLEQRVAERTAELQAANQRLETLSRAKDQFVSNVSHELRTPITNLKLRQYLLKAQPEAFQEHLDVLHRETSRLEDLIESLLMLSRLDQNRVVFKFGPVSLNELVEEYIFDRVPLAQDRGLALSSETTPDLPAVHADRRLIGQALSIILTNALLYTPAGGQIVVSTRQRRDPDRLCAGFSVRDTGPGIPADERDQLFARFFRGTTGTQSGVSGTGLGLAIAKAIVNRHQGQITVESAGIPGQGATFTVWLPVESE